MVKIKSVKVVRRGKKYQLHYYNLKGERRRISVGNNYHYAHKTAIKFYEMLLEEKDPETESISRNVPSLV